MSGMAISNPLVVGRAGPASLSQCHKTSKPSFERFLVRSAQSLLFLPRKRASLNPYGVSWSSSFFTPFILPQKCLHKRTTRVCAKQAGQCSPEEAWKDHESVKEPPPAAHLTRRSACIGLNSAILAACLGSLDQSDASTIGDPEQLLGQHSRGFAFVEGEEALSRRMDGRHVVITGGNSGIGKATARALAGMGMNVTLACRNKARGDAAAAAISEGTGNSSVRCMVCNLASLRSVREFAENYQKTGQPLDVLVNNAGVMACPQMYTEDGFEMQLGVNHLGHFLLTSLLLGTLASSAVPGRHARVVNVSSEAHRLGSLDFDDLNYKGKRKYGRWEAYAQSKLANILVTKELARRCSQCSVPIDTNALHPGIVDTQLTRYLLPAAILEARDKDPSKSAAFAKFIGLRTAEEGASTVVHLASSSKVEGISGGYYKDSRPTEPSSRAEDTSVASQLWAVSQELTLAPEFETSQSVPTRTAMWLMPT